MIDSGLTLEITCLWLIEISDLFVKFIHFADETCVCFLAISLASADRTKKRTLTTMWDNENVVCGNNWIHLKSFLSLIALFCLDLDSCEVEPVARAFFFVFGLFADRLFSYANFALISMWIATGFFRRAAVILRFTVCPMCAEFLVDQSGNKRKQPTNKKSYLWCDSSEFSSFTLRFNWIFLSRFFVLLPHAFRDWMQLNWFRCFFVWPIGINRALFAVRCCSYSLETLQLEFSIATDSPKNKNDLSYENINNYIQRDYNF